MDNIEITLEDRVLELRNELKTDRLDMSFGELINMYDEGMLIIQPEYQRSYRWKDEQKTRFIESILLGIPVPPIFVAEDNEGKWELVDGLQRISTIISFFGKLKNDNDNDNKKNNFCFTSTDLIGSITRGVNLKSLPLKLQLTLKRAVCRVEILRWDSKLDMRYELFNRLNTGASPLEAQEIRNCIFAGSFNSLLQELALNKNFYQLIEPSPNQEETMFLEELVLRFFAIKDNFNNLFVEKNNQHFLTEYMKFISKTNIDLDLYKNDFFGVINFLNNDCFDSKIFRAKNGLFTPNYFEAITNMAFKFLDDYKSNPQLFKEKIDLLKNSQSYKDASGQGTYGTQRIKNKIDVAEKIFNVK